MKNTIKISKGEALAAATRLLVSDASMRDPKDYETLKEYIEHSIPVVESFWQCTNKEEGVYMCDECGESIELPPDSDPLKDAGLALCPRCGAQMKEVKSY